MYCVIIVSNNLKSFVQNRTHVEIINLRANYGLNAF